MLPASQDVAFEILVGELADCQRVFGFLDPGDCFFLAFLLLAGHVATQCDTRRQFFSNSPGFIDGLRCIAAQIHLPLLAAETVVKAPSWNSTAFSIALRTCSQSSDRERRMTRRAASGRAVRPEGTAP
jgi:hypothetical protein